MSHVTHIHESCNTHRWIIQRNIAHINESWLIDPRETTCLYERLDSFTRVSQCSTLDLERFFDTCLLHSVTWLNHMRDTTPAHDMTQTYVWHASRLLKFISALVTHMCVTWLIRMCAMTYTRLWHNSRTSGLDLDLSYICDRLIAMAGAPHIAKERETHTSKTK